MSILLSPKFYKNSDYLNYAKQLLHHFVMTTRNLYGHQYLTHNMHGLVHIADSIKDFGPLDSSGAFPFENYLQQLKKMIHKGDKPLQQIVKRLSEIAASNSSLSPEIVDFPHFSHPHFNGPILSVSNNKFNQYSCIKFSNFKITNKHPNCYCYMKCGSIVVIENIVHKKPHAVLICREFLEKRNFYSSPFIDSSSLHIYMISNLSALKEKPVSNISAKMVLLPFKDKQVAFPLLHSDK